MCQVIECPGAPANATPYIVDCGSSGVGSGMNRAQTTAYVRAILARYSQKPVVILSHWDRDHHNWISTVLQNIPVSQVWIAGTAANYSAPTRQWIAYEVGVGATLQEGLAAGTSYSIGSCGAYNGRSADAMVVTVNTGPDSNTASLVWAVEFGDAFTMLMADATGPTQTQARANLLALGITPPFPVITGSHHGSDTEGSNSLGWAKFAKPDGIIFSAGDIYGHPRCAATEVYEPFLEASAEHPTRCGEAGGGWRNGTTTLREYVTSVLGNVVVDFDETGAYSVVCNVAGCATAALPAAPPAPSPVN
jgi:hypothetical protein